MGINAFKEQKCRWKMHAAAGAGLNLQVEFLDLDGY
jgi:hypothetical protein